MADVLDQTKKKMTAALEHLKMELKGLRTGRANPGLLDPVNVEVYGTRMRLKDMATVSVVEARQLLITPFDATNVHAIAKAIEAANLNLKPIVDGNAIRIKIPEMDQKMRQEMCKSAKKKCEDAKIVIRNNRREANDQIKKQKSDGDIPEDLMKKLEKSIQELTDKSCKLADDLAMEKEKEIMTV